MQPTTLKLGARGSLLSRAQSTMIARALEQRFPGLTVELTIVSTSGDVIQDRPLHEFGGKGLFTKELEQALIRGDVDFAVHSYKDVPVTMPLVVVSTLIIAATPPREDPRDLLASLAAKSIADLPQNARVGTGSLRRQAQLLAARPDLQVLPIRGNVDTRIRKLRSGEYDAVILATAGAKRSGLFDPSCMTPIDPAVMLPAAAQGVLALQCRKNDTRMIELLSALNDADTSLAVRAERQVVQLLNGDCHSPIAALATITANTLTLRTSVAAKGGHPPVLAATATADKSNPESAATTAVAHLDTQGVRAILH
jgi:hydroxymethylbilane synthase